MILKQVEGGDSNLHNSLGIRKKNLSVAIADGLTNDCHRFNRSSAKLRDLGVC
jgi:hypothetical protein